MDEGTSCSGSGMGSNTEAGTIVNGKEDIVVFAGCDGGRGHPGPTWRWGQG